MGVRGLDSVFGIVDSDPEHTHPPNGQGTKDLLDRQTLSDKGTLAVPGPKLTYMWSQMRW